MTGTSEGPAAGPVRSLSLRAVLSLLTVGIALYVVSVGAFLIFRIAPLAAAARAQDRQIVAAYGQMHERAEALSTAVRSLYPMLMPSVRDTLNPDAPHATAVAVRRLLDSLDREGSVVIEGGSVNLQVALARALESQGSLAGQARTALAAIRVSANSEAIRHLQAASRDEAVMTGRLAAAERIALRELLTRERDLSAAATTGMRAIVVWVVVGLLLLAVTVLVWRRRLDEPLASLDDAMGQVADGHLETSLVVRYDDELGRVSRHFNHMTGLLRQRAEEDRRHAEVLGRERTEAERARIFSLSADLMMVVSLEGRILHVNPAVRRILGFAPDDLTGRSFVDYIHPEHAEPTAAELGVLASGRAIHGFRVRFLRADGAYRWLSWSANAPESGVFYAVGRDVTDDKVAEEHQLRLQMELERSAREWRLTFDSIDDALLILDRFGAVTRLNAAARKLAGRSFDDVLGRSLSTLGPAEPWRGAADLVAESQASGASAWRQVRDAAGTLTWDVEATQVPGVEQRTILAIRDVTPMVELQDSLRRSETMSAMGQLVAGVAHEVRNPLFSMTATLDAFEARSGMRPEDSKPVTVMRNQLTRLTHLMEDLLEYGKPSSLELRPLSLEAVVAQAAEAVTVLAERQGVMVLRDLEPDLPLVMADRMRLAQVFTNLLSNAIQHSSEGHLVTLRVVGHRSQEGGWVMCSVRDGGPGFAQDDLPHVFEPFYTKRRGGTGLGLALVQRIVEQHGGTVVAANHADGGAELLVRLPAAHGEFAS